MNDTTLISRFQAAVDIAKKGMWVATQDIRPTMTPIHLMEATVRLACKAETLRLWETATDHAYPCFVEADARKSVTTWVAVERAKLLASLGWKQNLLEAALAEAVRRQTVITLDSIADAANMD